MISGIANCFGLVSALLFGFIFEKQKISHLLLITHACVVIGYVAFYWCSDPHHWLAIVSISVASFGFYGLTTLGYVIVNRNCGNRARGSVMGINCLAGAVAVLIIAKLGGMAFDDIDINAPFLFSAFCSFILLIYIICVRKKVDECDRKYYSNDEVCPAHKGKPSVNEEIKEEDFCAVHKEEGILDEDRSEDVCPIRHLDLSNNGQQEDSLCPIKHSTEGKDEDEAIV